MKRFIVFVFLWGSISQVKCQIPDSVFIRQIANNILTHSMAYENLRVLTKQIGAQLTGSTQMVKAEKWGKEALRKAGADDVWLQECMVPHWVRGGKDLATAGYDKANRKTLAVTALGNSVGTIVPLKANSIEIKDFDDLVKKQNEVNGRIVFYNFPFDPLQIG